MSILDLDNIVSDETVLIKKWLNENCKFIGCYPEIHNNIVDVKIDTDCRCLQPVLKITTQDVNLLKFGVCESATDVILNECPNLKNTSGLPSNINQLTIGNCPELKPFQNMHTGIRSIILSEPFYKYNLELVRYVII